MQALWPGLVERYGGGLLPASMDLSTLAYISEGYTAGGLDAVVHRWGRMGEVLGLRVETGVCR
jgi:hypothetical protein